MNNTTNLTDTVDLQERINGIEQMWDNFKNEEARASPITRKSICDILEGTLNFYLSSYPSKDQEIKKINDVKKHEPILMEDKFICVSEFINLFNEDRTSVFKMNYIYERSKFIKASDPKLHETMFKFILIGNMSFLTCNPYRFVKYCLESPETSHIMRNRISLYLKEGRICLKK